MCWLGISGFAGEVRVFTNKEGQSIRAEAVAVSGAMLQIRRESDGLMFSIPIGTLSLDDQVWIKNWSQAAADDLKDGEWTRLRIDLPKPADRVRVVGNGSLILAAPIGGHAYDMLLPLGAWVSLEVRTFEDPGVVLEHLVKFEGAKNWKVSYESRNLLISRDGGTEKIVGITLPEEDVDKYIDSIDRNRLDRQVCIEIPRNGFMGNIEDLGVPVVAYTCDTVLRAAKVSDLASKKPKALYVGIEEAAVDRLPEFEKLEALHLFVSVRAKMVDGEREKYPYDRIEIKDLPKVRDLQLRSVPFTEELGRLLADMGTLRMLEFYWTTSESWTLREPPMWEGLDRLAPTLQSFRAGPGIRVKQEELERLANLRALYLQSGFLGVKGEVKFLPDDMQQLLALEDSLSPSNHDKKDFAEWMRTGAFPKLRRLYTPFLFNMESMPALELLRAGGSYDEGEKPNLDNLAGATELFSLGIADLNQDDIKRIPSLPCARKMENLQINTSEFSDLSALSQMPKLTALGVYGNSESFISIDLGLYPLLTSFTATSERGLLEIGGISRHRSLRDLRIRSCEQVANLGGTAPNSVLQHLDLARCHGLTSISAFNETTALTYVSIDDCDGLADPLPFLDKNPLSYLSVRNCEHLKNRSIRDIRR